MPVVANRTLSDDEVEIGAKQETKTMAALTNFSKKLTRR